VNGKVRGSPTADRDSQQVELRFRQLCEDLIEPPGLIGRAGDRSTLDAHPRLPEQVHRVNGRLPKQGREIISPDW
jgi:hypothetical protein